MKAFYETRYYPTSLKVWQKRYKNVHFVPHWHSEIEFIFIKKGKVEIIIEGHSYTAHQGDLIICDGGLVHYSTSKHVDNELNFLIFDSKIINYNFNGFHLSNPILTKDFLKENHLFKSLIDLYTVIDFELKKQDILYETIISSRLQNFCVNLYRKTKHLDKREHLSKYEEEDILFQDVIDYIEKNYTKDIRLKDGASLMNMTESYFSTFFKARTNYTYTDYINVIRVENTIKEIFSTSKNFTEIAFNNGFNNLRTFNRAFKKYTGKSPSELSKKYSNKKYIPNIIRRSAIKYHTDFSENKTLVTDNQN